MPEGTRSTQAGTTCQTRGQSTRGRSRTVLVSSDPLLFPAPWGITQGAQPSLVFFSLISEERSSGNQCLAPAGGAAASLRAAYGRRCTYGAPTASFHTSNHQLPASHAAHGPTVLGNHSTRPGQTEPRATCAGLTIRCPFRPHHSLSFQQVWGTQGPCH